MARRVSAVSLATSWRWRPRYIRYVVPAVRTPRVVEALEHRRRLRREVLEVHVVDRVRERLLEAERLRGLEARAVLDVARLAAVVPVHRRDVVLVRARAGGDRGRAHRRHRRERGDAVVDVLAALDQQLQRRRLAARHRPLEHRGLHGVDDGEDELLHRRMRRPAYFSPSRRRPPSSSQARPPITRRASGGKRIESAGGGQRGALGVDGQRACGLGVEPAAHAAEQAARGERSRAPRRRRRATTPGDDRVPAVGERAGGLERAQHDARGGQRADERDGGSIAAGARPT